jgi:hypothetical protein
VHIAIDDTYGPQAPTKSRYVTGQRRTYVAVAFPEKDAPDIRKWMAESLARANGELAMGVARPDEFHFVDIYNRKPPWDQLPEGGNLAIIQDFADLYSQHRWEVTIQTVDDRTLTDHGIVLAGKVDELDVSKRDDAALLFLLMKLKKKYSSFEDLITFHVDEGRRRPGAPFCPRLLKSSFGIVEGRYAASSAEPLLQIADFLAFSINRSTHLSMKDGRTELDAAFLNMVGRMQIACEDILVAGLDPRFTSADFDALHTEDRIRKNLEKSGV